MAKKTHTTTKVDALLQTIKQTTPVAATSPSHGSPPQTAPSQATHLTDAGSGGKFSSIYLNKQDQRILRELSVWFAGQGLRINDTLVIRIALRAAQPGSALLAAYEEAVKSDRRFKQVKPSS